MARQSKALEEPKYCERMKRLVRNETKIEIRETTLCKRSVKIHQKYVNSVDAFKKQQQELQKLTQLVKERTKEVEERASFFRHVQKTLDATKERIANKRNLLIQSKSTIKQHNNMIMERMHILKEVTGTYINHGSLPERVKGVMVMQDKWIPFNYAADDLNELPMLLQNLNDPNNISSNKWQNLFLGIDDKMEGSRNANMLPPVTSIIEIDLTSPNDTKHT